MTSAGEPLTCDAFGNNAAVNCPSCNHSILFVALDNQKGSDESNPATCRGCKKSFYIEVSLDQEIVFVHEKH